MQAFAAFCLGRSRNAARGVVHPFIGRIRKCEVESSQPKAQASSCRSSCQVMGKRREPRKEIKVPVRIFGTDRSGQIFSEKVFTVNVSRQGVELSGVQAQPNPDEIVGITYGVTKSHFRVKWVGQPGSSLGRTFGSAQPVARKKFLGLPLTAAQFRYAGSRCAGSPG